MKVLFADGDWAVTAIPYADFTFSEWSGITHACGWFKKKRFTNPIQIREEDDPRCTACHDLIPLTLVGLWKMHNWDAIQEWENGQAEQEALFNKLAGSSFYGHAQPWPPTPTKCPQ